MAKHIQNHGINKNNISSFHKELVTLLKQYSAFEEGSKLELKTSNLKIISPDVSNCPPECVHVQEVCDKNGNNCHIKIWCECEH